MTSMYSLEPCPNCGCPFLDHIGTRTADGYSPWKDSDGKWYCGPAEERTTTSCGACGWNKTTIKRRGKEVTS